MCGTYTGEHEETKPTNEFRYANYYGYSDVSPYEITKVISRQTMEVRPMRATLDPNFKCGWFSACGQRHLLEDAPVRFYDYNF